MTVHQWIAGTRVRLVNDDADDDGVLYTVTGRPSVGEVTVRPVGADGPSRRVPLGTVVRATHGDATYLRHDWPVGSHVRTHGAHRVYQVVAHEPRPGQWYGVLKVRPLDTDRGLWSLPTAEAAMVTRA